MVAIAAMVVAAVLWSRFTASETYQKRDYFSIFVYIVMAAGCAFMAWNVLTYIFLKTSN